MAVAGWPDFASATTTDGACLDALFGAIEERAAVAAAAGTRIDFRRPLAPGAPPTHAALLAVQRAVLALAPACVRLDDPACSWDKWASFPRRWSSADVATGEHSVARLPLPGAPEGHPGSLARARAFLSNCAWWLDRFRAVDATPRAVYTRLLEASDSRHDGDGPDPLNRFGDPTVTDGEWPAGGETLCVHLRESRILRDLFDGTWHDDWDSHRDDSAEGRCYCGLSVANACGLPARCLLVPCAEDRPERSLSDEIVESRIAAHSPDDGDRIPGRWTRRTQTDAWHGAWRTTSEGTQTGVQSQSDGAISSACAYASLTRAWSADGSEFLVLGSESGDVPGWRAVECWEDHGTSITDFDGCGYWTCGAPVDAGVVAPYGRTEAFERLDGIPIPDGADLAALRRMRAAHPLDWNTETIDFEARVRLVPILDYHESFTHRSEAPSP